MSTAPSMDAIKFSAGGYHNCILRPTGAAFCWGDNSEGQTSVPP